MISNPLLAYILNDIENVDKYATIDDKCYFDSVFFGKMRTIIAGNTLMVVYVPEATGESQFFNYKLSEL